MGIWLTLLQTNDDKKPPLTTVALQRDHPKELQKLKAATGVQPRMIKCHFYKCAEVIRRSWSLTAGMTRRHAPECRVQARVTAASQQQGTSCHPTQTRHVFMSALPTSPQLPLPRLYQENPFLRQLAPLQLLYSTAKAGETLCPGNTFSSTLLKSCKLIQEGSVIRCLEGDTPIPAGTS